MPKSGDRIRETPREDRKRKKEASSESEDGWDEVWEDINSAYKASGSNEIDENALKWQQIMQGHRSGIIPTGTSSREKVVPDEKKKTDTTSTKTAEEEKQENITRKIKELKPGDFKALCKAFGTLKKDHSKNEDEIYYKYNAIIKSLTKLNSINVAKSTKYDGDLLAAIEDLHSAFSAKETIKKDCRDCKNVRISFPENSFNRLKQCFESIINENTH